MPAPTRKRHDAFEDFPVEGTDNAPAGPIRPVKQPQEPRVERIERLKPSQMFPDRFQPRRLLPAVLRQAFFSGQRDCYAIASQWLALAHQDPGYLPEVERLLAMGESFDEHGQIKPITGCWTPAPDGHFIFLIETGERRFWAACLKAVSSNFTEEPLLRVECITNPTRQRQVLENRHAEAPSAVSQACEVASLILAELDIQPTSDPVDEFDYFRQARAQRMPAGLWDRVMPVMQLTRPRMVQLLNILQLPTPLLEQAERYRLPERVLREILQEAPEQWERLMRLSIQNSLTSDERVETLSALPAPSAPGNGKSHRPQAARQAGSGLRRFWRSLGRLQALEQAQALDELADDLVASGDAGHIMPLIEELHRLVQARLTRR